MSRTYNKADLEMLWALSAGRCAFPGCRTPLVASATQSDSAAIVGEIAHICACSSKGPRADPKFPIAMINSYPNLILLCAHHHTLVDKQSNTYTIADLTKWKGQHEAWVARNLLNALPHVDFPELDAITSALINSTSTFTTDYTLIDPQSKMDKNEFTEKTSIYIKIGLSKSNEVADFILKKSTMDSQFPNRLKARFVSEYERLRDVEKLRGDALLSGLINFASRGSNDFKQQCAGIAVIGYLFERCEVFEK